MSEFKWWWPEKSHERWRKSRANGGLKYVLTTGVVGWGLSMFIVMGVLPAKYGFPYPVTTDLTVFLLRSAGIWLLAGTFFGVATWYFSEKLFQLYEREDV